MRQFNFAIAVWGHSYVNTMFSVAIPSFLAPGNLPACAERAKIRTTIVTRPEDEAAIRAHPAGKALAEIGELEIEPLLRPEHFRDANRYDVMARCHRYVIERSLAEGAVISILSPDCAVADGSLRFCLERILEGYQAVLIAGPRATLEQVALHLSSSYKTADGAIAVPPRDLVRLAAQHPHDISRLLYWDAQPFSQFPSAIYWRAGVDSFLARYFHLHPLFVDLSGADRAASDSGTVDGTLLTMARIDPEHVFTVERSDDACVIELSPMDHDPMGSLPKQVADKTTFVVDWAKTGADRSHRAQFRRLFFRFQGNEPVDWEMMVERSKREAAGIDRGLDRLDEEDARKAAREPQESSLGLFGFGSAQGGKSFRRLRSATGCLTRWLTPGPAAWIVRIAWAPIQLAATTIIFFRELRTRAGGLLAHLRHTRSFRPPTNFEVAMQHDYAVNVIPVRARHPGVFAKIAYSVLRRLRVVFVVNISGGMGHNTVEIDQFLRERESGKLDARARYALLRLPDPFTVATQELYGDRFWFASTSRFLYNLLTPVIARFPDIRLDCGLSRLKWQLRDDLSFDPPPLGQSFLHQVSKAKNRKAWQAYFRLRADTSQLHPLSEGLGVDPDLHVFLGGRTGRLALLHLKFHLANATAAPSDPASYVPAVRWLTEQGYRPVMIGREEMPAAFAELGVLDYAGSSVASYRHDLQLVALSELVVTAGSGIALMPDCMGRPLVYLDSWHLGMPMASAQCVMVPALITERATGRLLTFDEQMALYLDMEDHGDEIFPVEHYEARNAAPEEVLAAVREALALAAKPTPPSAPQLAFHDIDPAGLAALSSARVSEFFLRRHEHLLPQRAHSGNRASA